MPAALARVIHHGKITGFPEILGQVGEGTILDLPSHPGGATESANPSRGACVSRASDFRDGVAFFLTGTSFPGKAG